MMQSEIAPNKALLMVGVLLFVLLCPACTSGNFPIDPPSQPAPALTLSPRPVHTNILPVSTQSPEGTNRIEPTTPTPGIAESHLEPTKESTQQTLATLPITFPIVSQEAADFFNQFSRPGDLALIPAARLNMMPFIQSSNIRVGYASWAEAETALPEFAGKIEVIVYNPEHWQQTPKTEQENLVATVQHAAEVAHAQGFKLWVSPDRRFSEQYLAEIAQYADIIGLQAQRLQNDPVAFETWVRNSIEIARSGNPEVLIFVQVASTQGTAEEMYSAIQTVADLIDGISIWTNPALFFEVKAFIALIRSENE